MAQHWIAVNLVTGAVTNDLASFEPQWPLRRSLSNYDTATGSLHLSSAPPDWRETIRAGVSALCMYDDDDESRAIQWGGYITSDEPDSETDTVELSLTTIEGYLTRRFVGDVDFTVANSWHRDQVIAYLISNFVNTKNGVTGVPIQVVKTTGNGPALTEDLVMQNTDNATVFERVTTLLAQFGGEFAIEWVWSADQLKLVPTMFVGDHIGTPSPTGVPPVTFESPGPVVSIKQPTDYSDGAGANMITPYSSGQGSVTPYGDAQLAADFDGRPAFEYRWQPVASEDRKDVLNQYGQTALAILTPGARPLSLVLAAEALSAGTRFGSDWTIGDDVGYHADPCLAFPDGLDGTARVIAVERDESTITPIFAQPEVYKEAGL